MTRLLSKQTRWLSTGILLVRFGGLYYWGDRSLSKNIHKRIASTNMVKITGTNLEHLEIGHQKSGKKWKKSISGPKIHTPSNCWKHLPGPLVVRYLTLGGVAWSFQEFLVVLQGDHPILVGSSESLGELDFKIVKCHVKGHSNTKICPNYVKFM